MGEGVLPGVPCWPAREMLSRPKLLVVLGGGGGGTMGFQETGVGAGGGEGVLCEPAGLERAVPGALLRRLLAAGVTDAPATYTQILSTDNGFTLKPDFLKAL